MEKILNIPVDITTIPGKSKYETGTVAPNPVLFIVVITEGCVEELEYIKGIRDDYKDKLVGINFVILNDLYQDETGAAHNSNPMKRYEAIQEWSQEFKSRVGMDDNDEEFLICDRDNGSFKSEQYDKLVEETKKRPNFHLILSNPAFQIWLLFHFVDNIESLNLDSMTKSKQRIAVIEKELKKYITNYRHGVSQWPYLSNRVKYAMTNSRKHEFSLEELKEKSGTNFASFLKFIETKSGITFM